MVNFARFPHLLLYVVMPKRLYNTFTILTSTRINVKRKDI